MEPPASDTRPKINKGRKRAVTTGLILVFGVFAFIDWAMVPAPDLTMRIQAAREALERARNDRIVTAELRETALSLPDVEQADVRKALFIAKMLPLVARENARIRAQRQVVLKNPGPMQLNALALAYGLKPGRVDRAELLKRINVVPESLVLAQAAIESAWGTSRFAREGNAFFGERTYDPEAPGIAPKRASGFKVKSFPSALLSVRSYMRTLNAHKAYAALRDHRATRTRQGKSPSGGELAPYLGQYSEIGGAYVERILNTISVNRLEDFDAIQLKTR